MQQPTDAVAYTLRNQSSNVFKTGSFLSGNFAFVSERESVIMTEPRGKSRVKQQESDRWAQ